MKRLIRNSIFVAVIVAILVAAVGAYEGQPTVTITGDTPLEEAQNIAEYINQKEKFREFGIVALDGIDYQTATWFYTIMITAVSSKEISDDQTAQLKYFSLVKEVFVQTAQSEFAKAIVVKVIFSDGLGFFLMASEEAVRMLKTDTEGWYRYIFQRPGEFVLVEED